MIKKKMANLLRVIKKHKLIIFILFLGLVCRLYNYQTLFIYNQDQDLIGWFVKDIVYNNHFRLVGQETSTKGIFIGPLFYYFLIPFYWMAGFDPIGGFYGVLLVGIITLISFYYVFDKIFGKNVGLIASLIYAISTYTVFNDRWMVPTMTVFLWTIWFLYSLFLISKAKRGGFILAGILAGLIWNINMALVVLAPIVIYFVYTTRHKLKASFLSALIIGCFLVSIPLLVFELRHSFLQTNSFVSALVTRQGDVISGAQKMEKVLKTISSTFQQIVFGNQLRANHFMFISIAFLILIYLIAGKQLKNPFSTAVVLWILLYVGFFAGYSKILSEYYLDGLVVIYILIFSLILNLLLRKSKILFYLVISSFVMCQLESLLNQNINRSYYLDRLSLVSFIKKDSDDNHFPCVSISYITDPGYEFGYRYLFWYKDLKIKSVGSGVPVYSIVFPLSKVDGVDKYFGALGLILPDYQKDSLVNLKEKCSGVDYNISEPMWGLP